MRDHSNYTEELIKAIEESSFYQQMASRLNESDKAIRFHVNDGVPGYLSTLFAWNVLKRKTLLVVVPVEVDEKALSNDLSLLGIDHLSFPQWGTALYRGISSQAAIFAKRSAVLAALLLNPPPIVIASVRVLCATLPPPENFINKLITLKKGESYDSTSLEKVLTNLGYLRTPRVSVPGEFAVRGEVLDLFPFKQNRPVRILFAFDEIETIKTFDPVTQLSEDTLTDLCLFPLKEVTWDEDTIGNLASNLPQSPETEAALSALREKGEFPGEELLYPYAYSRLSVLSHYLDTETSILFLENDRIERISESLADEYTALHRQSDRNDLLPPPEIFLPNLDKLKKNASFVFLMEELDPHIPHFPAVATRKYEGDVVSFKDSLKTFVKEGAEVYIFAGSEAQSRRIIHLFKEFEDNISVFAGEFTGGVFLERGNGKNLIAFTESDLFGEKKKRPDSLDRTPSKAIDTFVDLSPGDSVIHIQHGIGIFKGIERMKAAGMERDYIALEFAEEGMLFVPIEQVNLVQRYIGNSGRPPKLDRLGGKAWEKRKEKARRAAVLLADRLLRHYARRHEAVGVAFPLDDDLQLDFEADFPYEETPDQITAVEEIKKDMEKPSPMDRLLCGDVGYGKTEVAMRACFKAVSGNLQAAVLCPTTILAEQHFESFTVRFKRFPVRIGMISRFVEKRKQREVIEALGKGEIDILIGTHRILSKDIRYKNLGLLVIDEEQRFGVRHKEQLKVLKTSVDTLTLSATPIPRTLHMSLVKIRDMSLLQTPPVNRHPIETFVDEFNPEMIKEAIERELAREGQVFFLHNRIESLENTLLFLKQLVPEALVESAHGQMDNNELEDIMHRFIRGSFQILVATTIIENGIDIPNVNTIIIDRADNYGVSQLYQLRGRVGRSERLAYAYLFYPNKKSLSELAMKRLRIISDFTDLGSGFKIAMRDIEVRGAGNLLGQEQSGNIFSVGFDLYLRLLGEALAERSGEKPEDKVEDIYLELDYSGYIPDKYIPDAAEKMELYKAIAAISTEKALRNLHEEVNDRFGSPPEEVISLLYLAEIRVLCQRVGIVSLREKKGIVEARFGKVKNIPLDRVMKALKDRERNIGIDPARPDILLIKNVSSELMEKTTFIRTELGFLLGLEAEIRIPGFMEVKI